MTFIEALTHQLRTFEDEPQWFTPDVVQEMVAAAAKEALPTGYRADAALFDVVRDGRHLYIASSEIEEYPALNPITENEEERSSMAIYYFVVYEHVHKEDRTSTRTNRILKDTHPVLWAATPPSIYSNHYTTNLLFWAEIPEEIAEDEAVQKMFGQDK